MRRKKRHWRKPKLERARPRKRAPLFSIPAIIALGSGAGRILSRISTARYGACKIAVNNSDRDIGLLRYVNRRLLVGENTGGSGMDVDKGRQDFLKGAGKMVALIQQACRDRLIEQPDLIPVIATLGHGFGSGSYPEALNLLRDSFPRSLVMAFAVTPFHFQGPEIRKRARASLQSCLDLGIPVTPIGNQVASVRMGIDPRKLGYNATYMRINAVLADLLSSLFSALSAEEGVVESLDRNDLRQMWQPESVLVGHATYTIHTAVGANSPADAEANMFVEVEHTKTPKSVYPTTYIIDTGGHVTISQISSLNDRLGSTYHADWSKLKPLIIERDRPDTKFILIRGGVELGL
jgi:cell division GTPase FtsZ